VTVVVIGDGSDTRTNDFWPKSKGDVSDAGEKEQKRWETSGETDRRDGKKETEKEEGARESAECVRVWAKNTGRPMRGVVGDRGVRFIGWLLFSTSRQYSAVSVVAVVAVAAS
jgi:hypothetical protein